MVITIMNEKGGVGKTTTAIQLAAGYAKDRKKTLLIDGDPQGGCTKILFDFNKVKEVEESDNTIASIMKDPKTINDCIWECMDNLDLIPSKGDLNRTMNELQLNPMTSYPSRLKKALEYVDYDVVVIDNNPYFTLFAMNAVVASDLVIIPTDIEFNSLSMINATLADIAQVIENLEDTKPLNYKILINKYNRLNIDRDVSEMLRERYGNQLYKTVIRTQFKPVKDAGFNHKLLIDDTKSNVASDYREFIKEVMEG